MSVGTNLFPLCSYISSGRCGHIGEMWQHCILQEICLMNLRCGGEERDEVSVANSVSRGVKFYTFLLTFHSWQRTYRRRKGILQKKNPPSFLSPSHQAPVSGEQVGLSYVPEAVVWIHNSFPPTLPSSLSRSSLSRYACAETLQSHGSIMVIIIF
jgi:hypothetical protein